MQLTGLGCNLTQCPEADCCEIYTLFHANQSHHLMKSKTREWIEVMRDSPVSYAMTPHPK